jgi:hypothetical protein
VRRGAILVEPPVEESPSTVLSRRRDLKLIVTSATMNAEKVRSLSFIITH